MVYTRLALAHWGQWSRGGLPTIPSMFAAIMGGPRGAISLNAPELVQRIDRIVCHADPDDRQILIIRYVFKGSPNDKAQMLGMSRGWYYRRLERAEWYVHVELDSTVDNKVEGCANVARVFL